MQTIDKIFKQAIILSVIAYLSIFTIQAQDKPAISNLRIGDPAPEIKIAKWFKGQPVNSMEKGEIYVLEFWATWCKPCIAGMPHLSELAKMYRKDVTIVGISIMERGENPLKKVEEFVKTKGDRMDYNVAADDNNFMKNNWFSAIGERGIPCAIIVNRDNRIAWVGPPFRMDDVLPKIINGSWDIEKANRDWKEKKRLTPIDGNEVVNRLNPFMGNPGNPEGALAEIEKILSTEPGLKYYPKLGHFTFWSLIKTKPKKAVSFAKKWFTVNDYPSWGTITDAVQYMMGKNAELPSSVYELAAESFQAQIDHYPWSMDVPCTYDHIANLYYRAGNKNKAVESEEKAIDEAKKDTTFPENKLNQFRENLRKYKN